MDGDSTIQQLEAANSNRSGSRARQMPGGFNGPDRRLMAGRSGRVRLCDRSGNSVRGRSGSLMENGVDDRRRGGRPGPVLQAQCHPTSGVAEAGGRRSSPGRQPGGMGGRIHTSGRLAQGSRVWAPAPGTPRPAVARNGPARVPTCAERARAARATVARLGLAARILANIHFAHGASHRLSAGRSPRRRAQVRGE